MFSTEYLSDTGVFTFDDMDMMVHSGDYYCVAFIGEKVISERSDSVFIAGNKL